MIMKKYKIRTEVLLYPGTAGWHFAPIPKKQTSDINKRFASIKRGWGSLPVIVTLGKTSWETSIFPDKKSGTYLLPLKASVRKKEEIMSGDRINFSLDVGL